MSAMWPPVTDLLVLPCAGASATMYLRWRRLLPEWLRVIPVELPGRGSRLGEPFAEDFDRLVALLCTEHGDSLRGRYALFGHSMGALLAYGIALRQRALARPLPSVLFVSGCPAPSRRDPERFTGNNDDASLIADLRKQGGTPEDVLNDPEMLRLTLDALAADYRICESFRYAAPPPLPLPIRVFAGRDDDIAGDRITAWAMEAGDGFCLDWFDGGHFFIRGAERELLAAIAQEMTRRVAVAGRAAGAAV